MQGLVFEALRVAVATGSVQVLVPLCDLRGLNRIAMWESVRRLQAVKDALQAAIEKDCALSVEALMQVPGLDLEEVTLKGKPPLQFAVQSWKVRAVEVLARHQRVSPAAAGALLWAVVSSWQQDEASVRAMFQALSPGAADLRNRDGQTALMMAVWVIRNPTAVKVLLPMSDVNATDFSDRTALELALHKSYHPEADEIGLHMPFAVVEAAVKRAGQNMHVLPRTLARGEREALEKILASEVVPPSTRPAMAEGGDQATSNKQAGTGAAKTRVSRL